MAYNKETIKTTDTKYEKSYFRTLSVSRSIVFGCRLMFR